MLFPFLSTLLILLGGASSLHVPHDDVHSVAIGLLADGTQETLITTSAACRVLRTRDGGLSWQTVHGDGLEMARADFVVFDPHPLSRKFFIGTNQGVWSYSPDMGLVQFASQGLPTGSGNFVTQLATSAGNSDGPLFLANKDGQVWAWNRSTSQWSLSLDSGFPEERGQVAVHPQFDSSGGVGSEQGVAAAFAGVLYLSADGGNTWSVHSQFSLPALLPTDPTITAIAFSQDYSSSGNLVLATARENLANFTLDEGTLWRSSDFGVSFSPVHSFSSSIRALVATPSGPSGDAWFLAGLLEHPNRRNLLQSSGVFRSLDGGASWDDYGSAQDFVAEEDASDTISLGREKIIGFAVSPDFQQSGRILFGRSEGLFSSADEGLHWHRRNFRPVSHLRGLDVHQDAQGDLWSFGASYGSGTIVQNLSASTVELLDAGPMNYQDELILSPQYEEDGMFVVGGARGLAFWFDPNKGMNNPHGTLGWEFPPHLGYVRFVAFSPHFDARGLLGTDQTFFLSSSTGRWSNVRSIDGGLTAEPLTKMVGGGPAPWLRNLSVARTYDASTSAGRTDVYGSAAVGLFRLEDDRWRMIQAFPSSIETLCLAPDFDRDPLTPGRPVIFMGMSNFPYFAEYIDDPVQPSYREYPDGIEDSSIVKVICPSDFATRPVVYAATFTDGVKKLDLRQGQPVWEDVGIDFPDLWVDSIALSPNFALDRLLVVGSQDGLLVGQDVPGGVWVQEDVHYTRDNEAPAFRYFAPQASDNPQPDRTWPWKGVGTGPLREQLILSFIDRTVSYADSDQSFVEFSDVVQGLVIHSFRGPICGSVEVQVRSQETGLVVANTLMDMHGPAWSNQKVELNFPHQAVDVKVMAHLQAGERFFFDGVTFIRN